MDPAGGDCSRLKTEGLEGLLFRSITNAGSIAVNYPLCDIDDITGSLLR